MISNVLQEDLHGPDSILLALNLKQYFTVGALQVIHIHSLHVVGLHTSSAICWKR